MDHRPRKRRKVAFNCDLVSSPTSHPTLLPSLSGNDVEFSSPNRASPSAALLPQSSKETKRAKSSTQDSASKSGESKSNTDKLARQDDEAIVAPEMSRKRRKKKDGPPKESGFGDASSPPEAQVNRVRKKAKKVVPKRPTGG